MGYDSQHNGSHLIPERAAQGVVHARWARRESWPDVVDELARSDLDAHVRDELLDEPLLQEEAHIRENRTDERFDHLLCWEERSRVSQEAQAGENSGSRVEDSLRPGSHGPASALRNRSADLLLLHFLHARDALGTLGGIARHRVAVLDGQIHASQEVQEARDTCECKPCNVLAQVHQVFCAAGIDHLCLALLDSVVPGERLDHGLHAVVPRCRGCFLLCHATSDLGEVPLGLLRRASEDRRH
mmetsp:Transcript_54780/g.178023  ORF Transcript_54780/g.178023 Transcript_54780/m.178023 type:complete len:243 (+) Transcript_54780:1921-2649(+)